MRRLEAAAAEAHALRRAAGPNGAASAAALGASPARGAELGKRKATKCVVGDSESEFDEIDRAQYEDDEPAHADDRGLFKSAATGLRSVLRGVLSLTATPAACGHDLPEDANKVVFQVIELKEPMNYVGWEFQAALYAERSIVMMEVPDRKQLNNISKTKYYKHILQAKGLWTSEGPSPPFVLDSRGVIRVTKQDREADPDVEEIWNAVHIASKKTNKTGDKVCDCPRLNSSTAYDLAKLPVEFSRRSCSSTA